MNNDLEKDLEQVCAGGENAAPPAGGAGNAVRWLTASILLSAVIISGTWLYLRGRPRAVSPELAAQTADAKLLAEIVPADGIALPVRWGDAGAELISTGVLDRTKFDALYAGRGGVPQDIQDALAGKDVQIKITDQNSGALLNLLWALGLAQKSAILTKGPMTDPRYGGAGNFASTGGWTLAKGGAMQHYSMHSILALDQAAEAKVVGVAQNIYRPCCGNSTIFPDCNHGMAMLGLLELMASEDASEADMYQAALAVNRFWFPDTYVNAAKYVASQGQDWENMTPKDLLSAEFSSGSGAQKIQQLVTPSAGQSGGGSCGV